MWNYIVGGIVSAAFIAAVIACVRKKNACSCACSGCAMADKCEKSKRAKDCDKC